MIATIITIHLFFATVYLVIKEPELVIKNKKVVLDSGHDACNNR